MTKVYTIEFNDMITGEGKLEAVAKTRESAVEYFKKISECNTPSAELISNLELEGEIYLDLIHQGETCEIENIRIASTKLI